MCEELYKGGGGGGHGGFLEHPSFHQGWKDMFASFIVWLSFVRVSNIQAATLQRVGGSVSDQSGSGSRVWMTKKWEKFTALQLSF